MPLPAPAPSARSAIGIAIVTVSLLLAGCAPATRGDPAPQYRGADGARPNIVLILADDLGYADVGAYGQDRVPTPNVDRLATEGVLFTQFYAGSTVCAPSRSALMTGQHTGHTFLRANPAHVVEELRLPRGFDFPIPDSVTTMLETLQRAGYITGVFGKWGLGHPGSEGEAVRQGVDEFFGYLSHVNAHYFYPEYLWDGARKVMLPGNAAGGMRTYSHDLIQARALEFIDEHRDEPFFLYLPSTIPHAELLVPRDTLLERLESAYAEDPILDAARRTRENYGTRYGIPTRPRAARAAMITRLDRAVGEVLDRLEALGLDRNTIVLFSSDNGPSPEGRADLDFFDSTGPLRGGKRDLYEGGIRVPLLVRWPAVIAPGRVTDHVAALWDIYPTLAELAGVEPPPGLDGISFLPSLTGDSPQPEHAYLYWEFHEQGGKQAVRMGDWKGIRLNVIENPDGPIELYHLPTDISESRDVSASHPTIVARIAEIMRTARTPSAVFPALNVVGD